MSMGDGIHIGAVIQNEMYSISEEDISDKTKARIKELKLDAVLEGYKRNKRGTTKLSRAMWSKANDIPKRKIRYTKKDYQNALDFLETFCLYSANKKILKVGDKHSKVKKQMELTNKTVKQIEKLNKELKSGSKLSKKQKARLRKLAGQLNRGINDIYEQQLEHTDQVTLVKKLNKAQRILEKM